VPAVRAISASEAAAVVDVLGRAGYTDSSRPRTVEAVLRAPRGFALVAERRAATLGAALGLGFGATGWIGGVGVVPEARRKGVATSLTAAVAERLVAAGARTLFLHATPAGRPIYERLGFVDETDYVVLEHRGDPHRGDAGAQRHDARELVRSDLDAVLALDRLVTGEDREAAIRAAWSCGGLAHPRRGPLAGFHLRSRWGGAATVSIDALGGASLLRAAAGAGAPSAFAALPVANESGRAVASHLHYAEVRRTTRMRLGPPVGWRAGAIFGIFNLYWG
jgi:GNAT superfamily N-acetyltransferase